MRFSSNRPGVDKPLGLAIPFIVVIVVIGAMAHDAAAAGVGGNLKYTYSRTEVEDVDDYWRDLDTRADVVSLGFSFDTNLARNRIFNYRIAADVQFVDQKLEFTSGNVHVEGTGVSLDQLFGFGIVRNARTRVFIGPSLHFGVARVDDDIRVGPNKVDLEETIITLGLGPEAGFNSHLGRHLTVSLTGYVRYGLQIQVWDSPFADGASNGDSDGVFVGDDLRAGLTTTVFFRFGSDQYTPRVRRAARPERRR